MEGEPSDPPVAPTSHFKRMVDGRKSTNNAIIKLFLKHGRNQTFFAISPLLSQGSGDGIRNGLIQQTFNKLLLRWMWDGIARIGMGISGWGEIIKPNLSELCSSYNQSPGLHKLREAGKLLPRKWRKNEKMESKRENGKEMVREWGNEKMERERENGERMGKLREGRNGERDLLPLHVFSF